MKRKLKSKILQLRKEGKTYNEIAEILQCNKSTICYHCKTKSLIKQDINLIQNYINDGHSIAECSSYFKMAKQTLYKAIKNGLINFEIFESKDRQKLYLVENSITTRSVVKKFIIDNNLITYECEICKNKGEWNNLKLVLVLDHKNGIHNDNRIENLRFLCPNCNSQQDTFAGKNKKYKKNMGHSSNG